MLVFGGVHRTAQGVGHRPQVGLIAGSGAAGAVNALPDNPRHERRTSSMNFGPYATADLPFLVNPLYIRRRETWNRASESPSGVRTCTIPVTFWLSVQPNACTASRTGAFDNP